MYRSNKTIKTWNYVSCVVCKRYFGKCVNGEIRNSRIYVCKYSYIRGRARAAISSDVDKMLLTRSVQPERAIMLEITIRTVSLCVCSVTYAQVDLYAVNFQRLLAVSNCTVQAVNDFCLVAKMSSHLRNGFAINNSRRESNEYLIYRVALFFNGSKSISSVKNTKAYKKRKIIIFLLFFSHYSKHYNVKMINF